MWKYQQGTPCPPSLAQHTDIFSPPVFVDKQQQPKGKIANSSNAIDNVFDDFNDNTTRNISKLMRDEFKNARLGMPQKPRRAQQTIGVFDEAVNTAHLEAGRLESERSGLMSGGAIKARRPQKIKLETLRESASTGASFETRKSAAQDASFADIQEDEYANDENYSKRTKDASDHSERDGRRRTIWVPSDDTTVMSIHPGAYDHTLRDDTLCLPPQRGPNTRTPKPEPTTMQQAARVTRQSMSVAPKRAPLRALAPIQPNAALRDRVKCMNGKENLPPGAGLFKDKPEKVPGKLDSKPAKTVIQPVSRPAPSVKTSLLSQSTAASQARLSSIKKRSAPELKEEPRKVKMPLTRDPRHRLSAENKSVLKTRDERPTTRTSLERQPDRRPLHKLSGPSVQPRVSANLSRYPVLPDDLVQPELYEDNWLSHQEVALTQLVNSVFQQADSKSLLPRDDVGGLRSKLLKSYQDETVVILHKRLKASLVYGALSMPKESKDVPRLREDVGLRRQFLDLWVHSYNLDALQAASEVIIGRAMTSGPRTAASIMQSLGSTSGGTASVKEREIRRFLLTFLIHHEDAVDPTVPQQKYQRGCEEDKTLRVGSTEWFWQRTVLNSFMLIHLLDRAKTSGKIAGCLFQISSIRKSSNSMLHALTRMVLPWIGDVTRPLGYLDFVVPHSQLPLSEYTYRIDNLATDLRNGVLLTRFVELLLYPATIMQSKPDQTLTLSLPDGETLTSILGPSTEGNSENWVLSQHLKFPCVGRSQKLHNASIALSALETITSSVTSAAISSTSAADIVDGHREKTLSLLWSLVSNFGLGQLVDWDELKHETSRFAADDLAFNSRLYLDEEALEKLNEQPDTDEQAKLLKAWAASICATKGITVTNLTTSFCSGEALACIVAAYSDFLPARLSARSAGRHLNPTAEALKALGCSESFTALFATTTAIPARSTTIALLAFLASRLLPLARSHRAARALQRAYRLRLLRKTSSQRVALMRLARDCAEVVRVQNEVLAKVVLLQRTWRGVLDARKKVVEEEERVLNEDVETFQKMARGWAVRKCLRGVLVGGTDIGGGRRRVMGGW